MILNRTIIDTVNSLNDQSDQEELDEQISEQSDEEIANNNVPSFRLF